MKKLLSYCWLLLVIAPLQAAGAAGNPADIEDFLHDSYYQIEFFVFERPEIMEFNSDEILALNRHRSLPRSMRTQRLDPDFIWTRPLDQQTRSCLTFPVLAYEMLQPVDSRVEETASARLPNSPARPVPTIHPTLAVHPLLTLMASMAEFELGLAQSSQRWQNSDRFVLGREAERVERTGLGRVLFHGRWLQAVPPRETPDPILIQAGEQLHYPVQVRELEGTVSVTLGRYLHFRAELFFHAPGLGLIPVTARMTSDGTEVLDQPRPPAHSYMMLSESRRMRSKETHYLDHPKLGVVIRIDPVEIPVELGQALEDLKKGPE